MALNFLFNQVQNAISNHANQQQDTGFNASGLLGEVESLFTQHAATTGQQILPASQDPYGDPGANILPASQDPYGDPGR
jgi:hypothetical protein